MSNDFLLGLIIGVLLCAVVAVACDMANEREMDQ